MDKPLTCPVLIGRTSELAALYSLIDVAKSGQGQAALICGEAGIGKSRLVAQVKSAALAQGFLLLQGECFQGDTSYPYAPLFVPVPAVSALEAGLSLAQRLGSTFWIATLTANLGRAYILNHDLAAAQATLRAVMPREQQPRNVAERDIALAWGELMLVQGAPGVALEIAERLLVSVPDSAPAQPRQPIPHLLKLKGEAR